MQRVVWAVVLLMLAVGLFIGLHPVSPARTFAAYQDKAKDTAETTLSAVETARLTADLVSRGRMYGTYSSVVFSESESSIGGAQSTFESVQPPDRRADHVRAELGSLLTDASDAVSTLRISARRGDTDLLAQQAKPLAKLADELNDFIEARSSR